MADHIDDVAAVDTLVRALLCGRFTGQWMRIVVEQMGYGRRWRLLWSRDGREWREVRSLPYTPDEADSMLRRQEEHLESRQWKPADLATELRMRRPSTSPVPTAAGGEATL